MTQLALFAEPVTQNLREPPIPQGSRWIWRWTKPGQVIREIRVKSVDGQTAVVCPTNFVNEMWPWTGRTLTATQLRKDWTEKKRRADVVAIENT